MKMRVLISACLVLPLGLSACVTGSTEQLFAIEEAPPNQAGTRNTGAFPQISRVPEGETKQLTEGEVAATKAELSAAAQKGKAAQARDNQADYLREVRRLKNAKRDQARRRAAIESGT